MTKPTHEERVEAFKLAFWEGRYLPRDDAWNIVIKADPLTTYTDKLEAELTSEKEENARLKECLTKWQDGSFSKPKHILTFKEALTEEQYERLKKQCEDNFGQGQFILLEGGLEYRGTTFKALEQGGE